MISEKLKAIAENRKKLQPICISSQYDISCKHFVPIRDKSGIILPNCDTVFVNGFILGCNNCKHKEKENSDGR